jgi:hypothetical protein
MGPETWGPHGWKFIHFITMGYPTHPTKYDKQNYLTFFNNLTKVIPCSFCADHFKDHMRLHPLNNIVLSSRDNLMAWGINMHNLVNTMHKKQTISKEEGIKLIRQEDIEDRKNCGITESNISSSFGNICIIIILIVFGLLLYRNIKMSNFFKNLL